MIDELKKSNVRHDVVEILYSDSNEETDQFIAERIPKEAYERKLTQSEDVTKWIDDPSQISLVQPNLQTVASHLRRLRGSWSILDVGCYAGYLYDYLAREVPVTSFSYTGVDIREEAIAGARAHHVNTNATFKTADLYKLSDTQGKDSFNVCISSRVLVHLPAFDQAMLNILHCAKNHAFIFVPYAKQGRCEIRNKVFVDTGESFPYVYRYMSEPLVAAAAKASEQRYSVYNLKKPYATIHFQPKRRFWSI